jgi:hypothetical protein
MTLSISDDDDEWAMFSRTHATARPIFFRSRAELPHVRDFAEKNFFARRRCAIDPDQLTDAEVPKSTEALDAFEDTLLEVLADDGAQTHLVAVTTGNGTRDRYSTAVHSAERPASVLDALTRSKEELEKASCHAKLVQHGSGALLGKLFGR